jgi:GPH family glycoside/pentoside/hexuronide:cation symporter
LLSTVKSEDTNAPETPARSEARVDARSAYSLYVGGLAEWTIQGIVVRLLLPILTTGFGIRPELVGWATTLPRLLDAVVDPLVGHLSDRTQSRWGRRRPYVFVGTVGCAAMLTAIWWISPRWTETAQFAYLLTTSVLFWGFFAVFSIPYAAMIYELIEANYQYRVRFVAIRSLVIQLPGVAMGWVYWLALRPGFGGEIPGIRWISAALSIAILVCGLVPALFFRERFAGSANSPGLFRALGQAVRNRPFVQLLVLRLLVAIYAIYQGLVFYINLYYVCAGDKALATKIWGLTEMAGFGLGFVVAPLAAPLSRRFDKRVLLFASLGCHLALGSLSPLLYDPRLPYLQVAAAVLLTPAGILFGTFCGASIPDICDLDELEHGVRREGLFGSSLVFIQKIEAAFFTLAVGYVLAFSGFAASLARQSAATLALLRLYAYAPYFAACFIALLLALRYPVTARLMAETRVLLQQRRALQAAS